ncbi:hypothetical protein [Pseudomonas sp. RIT-PI-S]|uniref:hypothetical protein n=1 Tax=Pseudomonas sp. RIT-PI-S TaxID=3035295 RepID=UPI0021DB2166|nr:hypothetical protein [Pseudomonas sp. RIT-PI-S]
MSKAKFLLLPKTTFNVNFQPPLVGCFTGYLPKNETSQNALYRFGIFHDSELITKLPAVEAGADLSSNPFNEMKILAVSFNDLNSDDRHDITVIGKVLIANGYRTFTQVYWGCTDNFAYEDKVNSDISRDVRNLSKVRIEVVQNYVRRNGFKARCGGENP